jgi:hypothetical protein
MHMQRERKKPPSLNLLYQVKQMFTHRDPSWKTPFSLLASACLESQAVGKFWQILSLSSLHSNIPPDADVVMCRMTDVTRFLFLYKVNAPDAWKPASPVPTIIAEPCVPWVPC